MNTLGQMKQSTLLTHLPPPLNMKVAKQWCHHAILVINKKKLFYETPRSSQNNMTACITYYCHKRIIGVLSADSIIVSFFVVLHMPACAWHERWLFPNNSALGRWETSGLHSMLHHLALYLWTSFLFRTKSFVLPYLDHMQILGTRMWPT